MCFFFWGLPAVRESLRLRKRLVVLPWGRCLVVGLTPPPRSGSFLCRNVERALSGLCSEGVLWMRCGWDISKASERNWVQRMQYKVRLQEDAERKRKEPTYRVTNCHEHNQSLKKARQDKPPFS